MFVYWKSPLMFTHYPHLRGYTEIILIFRNMSSYNKFPMSTLSIRFVNFLGKTVNNDILFPSSLRHWDQLFHIGVENCLDIFMPVLVSASFNLCGKHRSKIMSILEILPVLESRNHI